VWANTEKLESQIKSALEGSSKGADAVGSDIGKRISTSASKAMKNGWRPDQDIMAGIPDTKLDRIGARIGQVIGKGVVGGMRAREAGAQFGHSFAQGAGSIGLGRVISGWRQELSGGALNSMGMLAGKALSAGLTAAVGVGVAGAGLALTKGFNRLLVIDSAKYKLKGLGKSTQEIADIVQTVTDSVTGTPFALDQAFGTATQAIGSGVKDIKRFMTDVADAAGFAGVGIDRMGLIFNQVQAKGKLTGEEMMQLMEAGVPAKSWISESYNLTSAQFDAMQAKGEITMEMLQQSIEKHAGGMAKGLGDTLQGSIDQMQTAIARVGANFLSAIFGGDSGDATEGMKDAIQRVTEQLNNLDGWIKAHRDDIREFFTAAKDAAKTLVDVLGNILNFLKEHPAAIKAVVGAFVAWKAIEGVAALATALGEISTLLRVTLGLDAAIAGTAIVAGLSKALPIIAQIYGAYELGKQNPAFAGPGVSGPDGSSFNIGPDGKATIYGPDGQPYGSGPTVTSGGLPGAQRERRGAGPIDPTGGLLSGALGSPGQGFPVPWMPGSAKGGPESWRPAVQGAIAQYGPQLGIKNSKAWEDALVRQIATESGGNPGADNPNDSNGQGGKQHVSGLLQFLPTTFASHNITGGSYTDPMAQIPAALDYVMKKYGVDQNGAPLQIGRGVGYDSGGWLQPGVTQAVNNTGQPEAVFTQSQLQDMRTAGAIPAAAGSTAKAGESTLSKGIDMGGEIINGIIDQAASAASQAASVGITAGTMGAGAAAGPAAGAAASTAISMGTSAAKRGVTYGFDMLGIGADALLQQLTPFGMPRWLSQDPSAFAPQQAISGALGDLMSGGAQQAAGATVDPNTITHGDGAGVAPGPIDNLVGSIDTAAPPSPMGLDANSFLSTELAAPEAPPPNQPPMFKVDNIYTTDAESVGRELTKRGQLAQMQYTGRPAGG
jgi:tape measure domain-containing protein